jgi:hypothetical protein
MKGCRACSSEPKLPQASQPAGSGDRPAVSLLQAAVSLAVTGSCQSYWIKSTARPGGTGIAMWCRRDASAAGVQLSSCRTVMQSALHGDRCTSSVAHLAIHHGCISKGATSDHHLRRKPAQNSGQLGGVATDKGKGCCLLGSCCSTR